MTRTEAADARTQTAADRGRAEPRGSRPADRRGLTADRPDPTADHRGQAADHRGQAAGPLADGSADPRARTGSRPDRPRQQSQDAPGRAGRPAVPLVHRVRGRAAAAVLPALDAVARVLGYRLLRIRDRGGLGLEDGAIPYGTSVFDDDVPGVANLDAPLLAALRRAATDAAADGVAFTVNSGWRNADYQRRLRREAVAHHGSEEAAARWVSTPETSPHVAGLAVDLGPAAAQAWLDARGAAYGLCRIYGNEPWHFELRPEAAVHGRPPLYPTPADDPRHRAGT
ncbi:hypothetical protein GCM10009830_05420 [Glycomyces endophyticus]|uniref:D-alanyl-D-alanine carboxypeptidase-like core domain-containing protein n=1 Tax=Glycomyces endophyticus TaxID=480996 RepID=A0ABN2G0U0_9ACTN